MPVTAARVKESSRMFRTLLRKVFTLSRYLFFGELTSERPPSTATMATSAFVIVSTVVLTSACNFVHAIATLVYDLFTDDLGDLVAVAKVRLSPGSMLWGPRTARVLEDTRLKYLAMRKIIQELNDVLQYSTFVTVTCTLLTLCTCAYLISETESSWGKLVFTASYAVASSLELVHITVSMSQLKEQASRLSLVLEAPPISQLPKSVVQQVQLFKESLDIQLFCASGLGFFTVDKPLLVSVRMSSSLQF
ncbi:uncharacterized protein LOC8023916 [Ixodes scapularis]|uniref:uncharacterized protein LOC8023916 n=1 Tax=Ixodes scapularis TaxID=6945 RepID=UPI001A9E82B7|nr:uncharacterized protein LOC8023916 [Ixodes scapularis]